MGSKFAYPYHSARRQLLRGILYLCSSTNTKIRCILFTFMYAAFSANCQRDIYVLIMKPTRCTISQIYLVTYSTCFGQVHCPPLGVSQLCIHAISVCHASSLVVCWRGQDIFYILYI
jgi:hypothetical protein